MTDATRELVEAKVFAAGVSEAMVLAGITNGVRLSRLAQPGDEADVVVFLASERASFVNGCSDTGDGGLCRGLL